MFKLTSLPLEKIQLTEGFNACDAGAFVIFEGRVRNYNDGKSVSYLEYEAAEELCQKEAKNIIAEVQEKFPVLKVRCYHRVGRLEVGEMAVWVGVSAAHRDGAFKACRYIIDEVKKRLPIWKKEFGVDGKSVWVESRGDPAGRPYDTDIAGRARIENVDEQEYFSRQINLPEVGTEGLKKLQDAKVLVVGAGGLGCPALMSLAGAGIGTIGICEHDKIELSNLHRQFLYSFDDVGQSKTRIAKERIAALNPCVTIVTHDEKVHVDNVESIIDGYDIVLDCTDSVSAKYLLNDACFLNEKALVQSGIYQWEGQLRVMMPHQQGCLRCLWPNVPAPGCAGTCVDGGVLGVIPNIFGHLQAMEAIRIVLGMQKVFENELLIFNVADFNIRRLKIKPEENCQLCSPNPLITEILPLNYEPQANYIIDCSVLSDDELGKYEFIDVRETNERASDPLTEVKSGHIPVSRFTGEDVPFDKEKKYLLYCSKGIRSSRLAQMVREMGYDNVFSVKDGVAALRDKFKLNIE